MLTACGGAGHTRTRAQATRALTSPLTRTVTLPTTPAAAFTAAAQTLSSAKGYRAQITLTSSGRSDVAGLALTGTATVAAATRSAVLKLRVLLPPPANELGFQRTTAIVLGKDGYFSVPADLQLGFGLIGIDHPWVKTQLNDLVRYLQIPDLGLGATNARGLLDEIGDARAVRFGRLPAATIDTRRTAGYSATVTQDASHVAAGLWVDTDGLPRRLTVLRVLPGERLRATIVFTEFGAQSIPDAPAGAQSVALKQILALADKL